MPYSLKIWVNIFLEGVNFWTQMYKDEAYLKVDEKGNVTVESALIEEG